MVIFENTRNSPVETSLFWLSSRYYSPELCRFISPDDIEYLDPESVNGLNLYAYCGNDPVNKYDPTGHIAIGTIIGIIAAGICAVLLKGDSPKKYESEISEDDLNINGNNSEGRIIVKIGVSSFQIVDSYKYKNEEDMRKILEIIMNNEYYRQYGYSRSLESYLSEWRAHNAAYSLHKKGDWADRTRSVDFNKNLKDDPFWYLYWLF